MSVCVMVYVYECVTVCVVSVFCCESVRVSVCVRAGVSVSVCDGWCDSVRACLCVRVCKRVCERNLWDLECVSLCMMV